MAAPEDTSEQLRAAVARLEDYVQRALDEQQRVREHVDSTGRKLERLLAHVLQTEVARIREELAAMHEGLRSGPPVGANERSLYDSLQTAAVTAREALEQLRLLDATHATSLQALSEELRALREETRKLASNVERLGEGTQGQSDTGPVREAGSPASATMQLLGDVVRMHMDLLRSLLERHTSAVRGAESPAVTGQHGAETWSQPESDVTGESKGSKAKWVRSEWRSRLAAMEHQLHEVREQHDRRTRALERRLEDMQYAIDHLAAQDGGRRVLPTVAAGLLFVAAVVIGGLLWHRWTKVEHPGEQLLHREQTPTTTYARALGEAQAALARGDWESAERSLQEAARLRPDSLEVALARAALKVRGALVPTATPSVEHSVGADPGGSSMSCTIREGKLCCSVGPQAAQCVSWPTAAAVPVVGVVPTPKRSSRSTRPTPLEMPDLDDDDIF